MDTYTTLVELSKSLTKAKGKKQVDTIVNLIDKVYNREVRDESISKIKQIEDQISALNLKFLNG